MATSEPTKKGRRTMSKLSHSNPDFSDVYPDDDAFDDAFFQDLNEVCTIHAKRFTLDWEKCNENNGIIITITTIN